MTTKRKVLFVLLTVVLGGALASYVLTRPEPLDTRYTGAYAAESGELVFITPDRERGLRFRTMQGASGAVWPASDGAFEGGAGWETRAPVANRFEFAATGGGSATSWTRTGAASLPLQRLALPERIVRFDSGEITLRGKLVTPAGTGPFPVVVLVHGSEDTSAVDHYFEPYLYAAHGLAAFVFDKRGTGESGGEYLQNFHVLSDDVVAALRWLRTQPQVDRDRMHLAGFSQGGWIAPLAARKDGGVRSILVGYGVMVPVTGEDRWGYLYALQQKGFGAEAIAAADRVNAIIGDVVDRRLNRWSELQDAVAAVRNEPWFEAVKGSDSTLGFIAASKLPWWAMRAYVWWLVGEHRDPPFIDRLYDPVPTLAALDVPSYWILAGEDSSAPAQWTLDALDALKRVGKPVEYRVFPQADHGILSFTTDARGQRQIAGYEPEYLPLQIEWFKRQSGTSLDSALTRHVEPRSALREE